MQFRQLDKSNGMSLDEPGHPLDGLSTLLFWAKGPRAMKQFRRLRNVS